MLLLCQLYFLDRDVRNKKSSSTPFFGQDTFRINEIELRLKLFDRIAPMSPEDLRVRFDACGKHYRIESNGGGPDYDTKEPAFYAIAIRNIAMQLILNHGFAGAPFASPRRVMGPRRRFLLTRPIPATLPPHIQYRIGTVVQRMQVLPDSERPAAYGTRAQCELEARGWFALASMHDRPHPLACAALAACLLGSEADSGGARATLPRSYHDAAFFLWRGSQHGAAWPGASAADSREARELCAGRLRDLVNKGHRAHFAHLATKDWPAALPPPTEEEAHALVTLLHMGPVRLQQLANPPFSDPRAMYLVALQQLGTPDLRVYAYLDLAHDTTTWLQQVWVWVLCSEQLNEGLILSLLQASRDGGFAPAAALLEAAGEESEAGFPEHCRRLVAPLEPGLKSYWEDTACPMESDGGRITATPSFSMQPKKGHPLEAAASAKEKQALVREEMRKARSSGAVFTFPPVAVEP